MVLGTIFRERKFVSNSLFNVICVCNVRRNVFSNYYFFQTNKILLVEPNQNFRKFSNSKLTRTLNCIQKYLKLFIDIRDICKAFAKIRKHSEHL